MNPLQSKNKNSGLFVAKKENLIRQLKFCFFASLILILISNKVQAQAVHKTIKRLSKNPPMQSLFSSHEDFKQILEEQNIKNLSQKEIEALAYASAVNNPIYLMRSLKSFFNSDAYKAFFFLHFDLNKHGDGLFAHLFTKKVDKNPRVELGFFAAKKNWRNFIRALQDAIRSGQTQINQTDLEAAALTFIHTKLSPFKKFENYSAINDSDFPYTSTRWFTISIASFFHEIILDSRRHLEYYMNPYFKLGIMDPYFKVISRGVISDEAIFQNKDAIVKIWNHIKAYGIQAERQSDDSFLKPIFWSEEISLISRFKEHIEGSLKNTDISLDPNGRVHVTLKNEPLFRNLDEIRLEDESMQHFLNEIISKYIRNSQWNINYHFNERPYTF